MKDITASKNSSALKVITTTFGVLAGFFGMEHGFFEILQGNTVTGDIMIHSICYPYLGFMLFTILTAFAYDTCKQTISSKTNRIEGR